MDGWHGGANYYHAKIYFSIDNIDDNFVTGRYSIDEFVRAIDDDMWTFSGKVNGNTAVCDLYIDSDKAGKMELLFSDNGTIRAEIAYGYLEELPKSYIFRSYNLNDVDQLRLNRELTRVVDIDTWGKVYLVAGVIEMDKPYPVIYMTNRHDDILYEFKTAYQNASEIYDMSVGDYNVDGLDDIQIVTYFPYEEDSVYIEHTFYQTDNGMFKIQ